MPKHVKGRDRDKYYHLAKDQGFRARSAFKLIQIDQRLNLLSMWDLNSLVLEY